MALCTIIAKARPQLLDLAAVEAQRDRAVSLAMAAGEAAGLGKHMLWVEAFLQPEWVPDDRAVFAYVAALARALA